MEATGSRGMLVSYHISTRNQNPELRNLKIHLSETLSITNAKFARWAKQILFYCRLW